MVKGRMFVIGAAGLSLSVAAVSATHSKRVAPSAETKKTEQLLQNCEAHKFETVVQEMVEGQPHQSKVKLCGKEGQTDQQWIGTLKDAVAKLKTNSQMAAAIKDQIITALDREIARLSAGGRAQAQASSGLGNNASAGLIGLRPRTPGSSTTMQAMGTYPALPSIPTGPAASLPPPRAVPQSPPVEYAALPPLPTAPPPATHVLGQPGGASLPLLPALKMSFSCFTPESGGDGPCTAFTRDTVLTVHADENFPAGASIRFVRDGDPKADVLLATLRKGASMQFAVPVDVCKHVVGGRLELKTVRGGQEVDSNGPYNLNCY